MSVTTPDISAVKTHYKNIDEKDFMEDENLQRIAFGAWLRGTMEDEGNGPSPIDIDPKRAEPLALPPMKWYNYMQKPKLMKVTNTGNTIIVSAKWKKERPYLLGGPFRGSYVFSQMHFHWGSNDDEGSEHSLMGESFPLELHVAYFKTAYKNQETALKNSDGTAMLVYLYRLDEDDNDDLRPVFRALPRITKPRTSQDLPLLALADLGVENFEEDYFFYYGSVDVEGKPFPVMWFIWPNPIPVSSSQVDLFRNVFSTTGDLLDSNFRPPLPAEFGKNVFFVYGGPINPLTKEDDSTKTIENKSEKKAEDSKMRKPKTGLSDRLSSLGSITFKNSNKKTEFRESKLKQGENTLEGKGYKQKNHETARKTRGENGAKDKESPCKVEKRVNLNEINPEKDKGNESYVGNSVKNRERKNKEDEVIDGKNMKTQVKKNTKRSKLHDQNNDKIVKTRKSERDKEGAQDADKSGDENNEKNNECVKMGEKYESAPDEINRKDKEREKKAEKIEKARDERDAQDKESPRTTDKIVETGVENKGKNKDSEENGNISVIAKGESRRNGRPKDTNTEDDKDRKERASKNEKSRGENSEKDKEHKKKSEKNKGSLEKYNSLDSGETQTYGKDKTREVENVDTSIAKTSNKNNPRQKDHPASHVTRDSDLTRVSLDESQDLNESQRFDTSSPKREPRGLHDGSPTTGERNSYKENVPNSEEPVKKSKKSSGKSKDEFSERTYSERKSAEAANKNTKSAKNDANLSGKERRKSKDRSPELGKSSSKPDADAMTKTEKSRKSPRSTHRKDAQDSADEMVERRPSGRNSPEESLEEMKSGRRIHKPIVSFANVSMSSESIPSAASNDLGLSESAKRDISDSSVEESQHETAAISSIRTPRKSKDSSKTRRSAPESQTSAGYTGFKGITQDPKTNRATASNQGNSESKRKERVDPDEDELPSSSPPHDAQGAAETKPRSNDERRRSKALSDPSKSVPSMPNKAAKRRPDPEDLRLSSECIHDRDKWNRIRKLSKITDSTYSCFLGTNPPSAASLPPKTSRYQLESYLPDDTAQSPINIDSTEIISRRFIPLEWSNYDHSSDDFIMTNANGLVEITTHHEVQNLPFVKGGPLNGEYLFSYLVFLSGSEHTIDNQRFSIEAQILFFKQDYGTLTSAIIEKDGLIALGFFLEVNGKEDNDSISKLLEKIRYIQDPQLFTTVDFIDLLNDIKYLTNKSKYLTYMGSLTVPPYTSCTWIIFPDPVYISKQQAEQFQKLHTSEDLPRRTNRPIQPLHDRDVILAF